MPAPDSNFGPSLEERLSPQTAILRKLSEAIMQKARVALPGVVRAFYPGPPATVDVAIATVEYVLDNPAGPAKLQPQTTPHSLPLLQQIPLAAYCGGGWNLTFPVQPGDEVLVVFSDTCIDAWFQNGAPLDPSNKLGIKTQWPVSPRRHNLADGIAAMMLRSSPRGLQDFSATDMELRNDAGTVKISLGADGDITISAPNGTVTVNAQNADVKASVEASITAPTVKLGSVSMTRDFLLHSHTSAASGSPTGPVL
jgi:hypothetical protein